MAIQNYRDLIGGVGLMVMGVFVAIYAYQTMPLGTVARMGPGLMPFALGILLAALGAIVTFGGFMVRATLEPFALRPFAAVIASILLFALLARPFGILIAVGVVLGASTLAELKTSKWQFLSLLIILPTAAYLIFSVGLGVSLPLFNWPFR